MRERYLRRRGLDHFEGVANHGGNGTSRITGRRRDALCATKLETHFFLVMMKILREMKTYFVEFLMELARAARRLVA